MTSSETNVPHLTSSDVDLRIPTDHDFKYYGTHDFRDYNDINECMIDNLFSVLNCNIICLSANFDSFRICYLSCIFPFQLTSLTETELKCDQNLIANTEMMAYDFISQPSKTNAGGVGFDIRN